MQIIFETTRLLLRRFTLNDTGLLLELNSDPEVLKYLHEPPVTDHDHARQVLSNIILPQYENNLGRWAIHVKDDMRFVGWCGLKYRPEIDETDLGYRFMKKEWGKGFATEAARQTIEHGLQHLHLDVITGRAHIENTASLHVLEKIGMKYIKDEIVDDCPVKTYIASR